MKEYFKVSDVLGDGEVVVQKLIGDSQEIRSDTYGHVCVVNTIKRADIIAHAINSHDELVEMSKELLGALEAISSVADQERGNAIEMQEMADAAISKAKGGAA